MVDLYNRNRIEARSFAGVILDIGAILMESGAHCDRIDRNVKRIAAKAGFDIEIFFSFTAISLTVTDRSDSLNTATSIKGIKHHGVHFGIVTQVSLLTWNYHDGNMSFVELAQEVEKIKGTPRHNRWLVRFGVGIACGCLCLLAGGDLTDGTFAFIASVMGLMLRQTLVGLKYNLMVAVLASAFLTTIISGLDALFGLGAKPDTAVATAVLFLVPGVPLINCIIDLVKGYYPTAVARGVLGSFVLLCIAVGMFVSMSLIGINNF